MKALLKRIYSKLPSPFQKTAKALWHLQNRFPLTTAYKNKVWMEKVYGKFAKNQRHFIFLSIARFCVINRPIEGYYFEFGCHGANTMRMAWDTFHRLFDWTYVAFDSFEGLPEIDEIDRMKIWEKGKLMTTEAEFINVMAKHGVPRDKLITVKGFYHQSLTVDQQKKLLPNKAAVIYIDCDLYKSTVPVLEFIRAFLQKGTIIVFDDWNCFHADPNRGERRAFREFLQKHPSLKFEDFVSTNEAKSFIYLGEQDD